MQARTIIDKVEIELQTGNIGARKVRQVIDDDAVTIVPSNRSRCLPIPRARRVRSQGSSSNP